MNPGAFNYWVNQTNSTCIAPTSGAFALATAPEILLRAETRPVVTPRVRVLSNAAPLNPRILPVVLAPVHRVVARSLPAPASDLLPPSLTWNFISASFFFQRRRTTATECERSLSEVPRRRCRSSSSGLARRTKTLCARRGAGALRSSYVRCSFQYLLQPTLHFNNLIRTTLDGLLFGKQLVARPRSDGRERDPGKC